MTTLNLNADPVAELEHEYAERVGKLPKHESVNAVVTAVSKAMADVLQAGNTMDAIDAEHRAGYVGADQVPKLRRVTVEEAEKSATGRLEAAQKALKAFPVR